MTIVWIDPSGVLPEIMELLTPALNLAGWHPEILSTNNRLFAEISRHLRFYYSAKNFAASQPSVQ
jgi:hypothetical protein